MDDLAIAKQSEVIKLWQGLGYNRRAIWLQEAAKSINMMNEYPRTWKELIKIKGIGPYAARSIPIFAFNSDYAAVDTNIKRIYLYKKWINDNMKPSEIQSFADQAIPKGRSRDYHNALMDYGSIEMTSSKTGISTASPQSKFRGSRRQIRGVIINSLVELHQMNKKEIKEEIDKNDDLKIDNLDGILCELITDGLIIKIGDKFQLPE